MNRYWAWGEDTAVRCIKTFAQTMVGTMGVTATGLVVLHWQADLAIAGTSALACLLHNVSSFPVRKGAQDDPG